jgi:hypothetical protein
VKRLSDDEKNFIEKNEDNDEVQRMRMTVNGQKEMSKEIEYARES